LNWNAVKVAERDFDRKCLEQMSVQVVVPDVADAQSDDLFESPGTLSSGVFTVPGTFEHWIMNQERFLVGGRVTDASGYFLAGEEWKTTFQKNGAYVLYDNTEYAVATIDGSPLSGSILVRLKKK